MKQTDNAQPGLTTLDSELDAIAKTVTECNLSKLVQEHDGFRHAFALSAGVKRLRELITPDIMAPIMELHGTRLGFRTDKDKGRERYPIEVVKDCLIEAVLRGVRPVGNEFNIIAGNCYITKEGYTRLVREHPGLTKLRLCIDKLLMPGGDRASVLASATWTLNGEGQEFAERTIPIRVNTGMGPDGVLGKATRKLLAAIYAQLTGSVQGLQPEGDVDDLIDVAVESSTPQISVPTRKAPASLPAAQPATTSPEAESAAQPPLPDEPSPLDEMRDEIKALWEDLERRSDIKQRLAAVQLAGLASWIKNDRVGGADEKSLDTVLAGLRVIAQEIAGLSDSPGAGLQPQATTATESWPEATPLEAAKAAQAVEGRAFQPPQLPQPNAEKQPTIQPPLQDDASIPFDHEAAAQSIKLNRLRCGPETADRIKAQYRLPRWAKEHLLALSDPDLRDIMRQLGIAPNKADEPTSAPSLSEPAPLASGPDDLEELRSQCRRLLNKIRPHGDRADKLLAEREYLSCQSLLDGLADYGVDLPSLATTLEEVYAMLRQG